MQVPSLARSFAKWRPHLQKGVKQRFLPQLGLKTRDSPLPVHDYINFSKLTGNELLYNLKNAAHFRHYELSNAFIELGLKKGAPSGYDWSTNYFVQIGLAEVKRRIPSLPCKALTSLAHGCNRLGLADQELWDLLEQHIIRLSHVIEPRGISNALNAMGARASEGFMSHIESILPLHARSMSHRDLLGCVRGFHKAKSGGACFEKWLYPLVLKNRKMYEPAHIEELMMMFAARSDCTEETQQLLKEALEHVLRPRSRVHFIRKKKETDKGAEEEEEDAEQDAEQDAEVEKVKPVS